MCSVDSVQRNRNLRTGQTSLPTHTLINSRIPKKIKMQKRFRIYILIMNIHQLAVTQSINLYYLLRTDLALRVYIDLKKVFIAFISANQ